MSGRALLSSEHVVDGSHCSQRVTSRHVDNRQPLLTMRATHRPHSLQHKHESSNKHLEDCRTSTAEAETTHHCTILYTTLQNRTEQNRTETVQQCISQHSIHSSRHTILEQQRPEVESETECYVIRSMYEPASTAVSRVAVVVWKLNIAQN